MTNYSGHFFCSGKRGTPEFSSSPMAVHPGAVFSPQHEANQTTLLAGGFPAIHPDSPFPLSPTLQLNGDLTNTNTTGMAVIARAELTRHNNQSYRSYTLEADSRITVIGSNPNSLQAFINNYGGVLQIAPLLTRSYDPELTTAQDLQVKRVSRGFIISFTVKQPIDSTRCTYCGACGSICPQQCLHEQLFLDFSLCTLCKECTKACPHGAVDLHSVERRELITPAILLLDETEITLPEKTKQNNIYSEAALPDFFETIYATEIDEIISWSSTFCQYSAKLQTGCTVCLDSCPHAAIKQDKYGVHIDHFACVECGACLANCPTGSLQYKRFDDMQFMEYFKMNLFTPGTRIVIGDEQALHKYWWHNVRQKHKNVFFMEYPQPAALHSMHFLQLYGMGAKQIIVLRKENGDTTHQIQLTNALLQELTGQDQTVCRVPTGELNNFLERDEESRPLSNFYSDFAYTNRRKKLIDLLMFLSRQSSIKATLPTDIATDDFGEILCDEEQCTQCVACVNECRVGALTANSENYSLNHTPALCVQCGTCVTVCPENALRAKTGLSLQDVFFRERIVAQADPARCKGCGKVFGTRKSLEKVMSILSAKGMWDNKDDLLSYCDDCRVVNLYNST